MKFLRKHGLALLGLALLLAVAVWWLFFRRVSSVGTVDIPIIGTDADFGSHTLDELDACLEKAMSGDGTC